MAVKHHSREPIPNTCPDIDKVIVSLSSIVNNCKFNSDYSIEDLQYQLNAIESECYGLDTILEQLRSANEQLRSWGKEEAENYDRLEEEYDDFKARMDI